MVMERATEALWKAQYLPTEDKHVDSLLCLLLIRGAGRAGRHMLVGKGKNVILGVK